MLISVTTTDKIWTNGVSVCMKIPVKDPNYWKLYNSIPERFRPKNKPHITLFTMFLNPSSQIYGSLIRYGNVTPYFRKALNNAYLNIQHTKLRVDGCGEIGSGKYYVMNFSGGQNGIHYFRRYVCSIFSQSISSKSFRVDSMDYSAYHNNSEYIYAVRDYDQINATWHPHMSLIYYDSPNCTNLKIRCNNYVHKYLTGI